MVENLAINKYTVVINIQSQFQQVSASVINHYDVQSLHSSRTALMHMTLVEEDMSMQC